MQQQSFLASIFHAFVWKIAGRGAGFFKHIFIAAVIGLSAQLDIFFLAASVMGLIVYSWGEVLDVLTVPYLVKADKANDTKRFRSIAGGMFILTIGASLVLCLLVISFRDAISLLAFGFEPILQKELADAIVWLAPVIILHVPLSFLGSVLRAKRRFSPVYQAEALIAFVVLACVILRSDHQYVLLWSLSVGTVAGFIYAIAFSARHFSLIANPFDKTVLDILRIAPALLVLHSAQFVLIAIERVYITFLPVGSISAMAYALILASVIPHASGIQSSFMTVVAEKAGIKEREKSVNDLLSLIIFLSVGATSFLVWAAQDFITIIFERGVFGSGDTAAVKTALHVFAFIVAPTFLLVPLVHIFQIEKKIGIMVRCTSLGIFTSIILYSVALFVLDWGIFGLALGLVISNWLICVLAIFGLTSIGYRINYFRHFKWVAWLTGFIAIAVSILYYVPNMGSLTSCIVAAIVIGTFLLGSGMTYRGHERNLVHGVLRRLSPLKG